MSSSAQCRLLADAKAESEVRDAIRFVQGYATKTQTDSYVQGLKDDYISRSNPRPLTVRVILVLLRDSASRGAPSWVIESGAERIAKALLPSLQAVATLPVGKAKLNEEHLEGEAEVAEEEGRENPCGFTIQRIRDTNRAQYAAREEYARSLEAIAYPVGAA